MSVELTNLITPVLITIFTALIAAAGAYLTKVLKELIVSANKYLESKVDATDYAQFRAYAKDKVLMLLQHPTYKDLTGPEKKEMAIVKITQYLQSLGINAPIAVVSEMVEAVYAEIKLIGSPLLEEV